MKSNHKHLTVSSLIILMSSATLYFLSSYLLVFIFTFFALICGTTWFLSVAYELFDSTKFSDWLNKDD